MKIEWVYLSRGRRITRGLADCCHRGEERRLRHSNKMVRPWLWHAPTSPNSEAQGNAKTCPHCGGLLP